MRLLVPTRICLALRWATTPAASRVVTRTPKGATAPRDTTAQLDALALLDAGKNEEFRAQWKFKILGGFLSDIVALHEALLRCAESGKADRAMLRWYAESLVDKRQIPFPAKPNFEMMAPVVRALGGKIEKWKEDDKRKEKLLKWRDNYSDEDLEKLLKSMLEYADRKIDRKNFTAGHSLAFKEAIKRVNDDETTVAVDWSDIVCSAATNRLNFEETFLGYTLVKVGREAGTNNLQLRTFDFLRKPHGKAKNDKHPFTTEPSEVEGSRLLDGRCTLMLAVASRGHWLSNGTVKQHTWGFDRYLRKKSGDVSLADFLKSFANDSVLRYSSSGVVQPPVDHSRAPQFIDKEKKELAFTVAFDLEELPPKHPYKSIEYYSLHLD